MSNDNLEPKNKHLEEIKQVALKLSEEFLVKLQQKNEVNRLPLLEFISHFSDSLDKTILSVESREQLNYQAGNVYLRIIDNNNMQFHAELYYQNAQSHWVKKELSSPIMDMELYLNDTAITELKATPEMKFPVTKPTKMP